jgi:hypothetical protein
MLEFKKENGFPIDVIFDTQPCGMMDGYISDIFVDGILKDRIHHTDLDERKKYAERIFEEIKENEINNT